MNWTPIICSGNELEEVLAGIRERGGFVVSLETGIGKHNADYRVSYFERAEELAPPVAVRQSVDGTDCQQVNNPAALNPFPPQCETPANPAAPEAVKGAVAPRDPLAKMAAKALVIGQPPHSCVGAETAGVEISDSASSQETPLVMTGVSPSSPVSGKVGQGESRSSDAASMAVGRAGRNPVSDRPGGVESSHLGLRDDLSIETRMAKTQERLRYTGKLRIFARRKRTNPKAARLPYVD